MSKHHIFQSNEITSIIERFGSHFFEKVEWNIAHFTKEWSLEDIRFIPSYSANIVFTCSSKHGAAILKMAPPISKEFIMELAALQTFQDKSFCKLYSADVEHKVMLLEWIRPGTTLREEFSLGRRLDIFCSVYRELHLLPQQTKHNPYPTYLDWVNRITSYMSQFPSGVHKELFQHMSKAQQICTLVAEEFNRTMLLHGDLHHDNLLLDEDGSYRIIDPKGVLGDPVFDIPRFVLNEFGDETTDSLTIKVNEIFQYLEGRLQFPQHLLRKLLYIETTMGACWSAEDGAGEEELRKELTNVKFTESLLLT